MDPASLLPSLLTAAWLIPLASFVVIVFFGKHMGPHGKLAGHVATLSIGTSCLLSMIALFGVWLPSHPVEAVSHGASHGTEHHEEGDAHQNDHEADPHEHEKEAASVGSSPYQLASYALVAEDSHEEDHSAHSNNDPPPYYTGEYYTLASFGSLKLVLSYYIDTLTVVMFCMVTLIATCVHVYAMGYMHDELHDFTDHEVTLSNGAHLKRPGRYWRFFQYLSLFCFSMLGIVIAGNLAMVFVFWELVGICSYFLIGFYIERHSASTAANKAFIVNRVGDFGMLIGMMALWASVGTFAFGDMQDESGKTLVTESGEIADPGLFTQLRTAENDHHLVPTEQIVKDGERLAWVEADGSSESDSKAGSWLLLIAGVGVFCGCIGKSAQFPLHVWLPDAMEGPTPVSALVHSATMVAAGVYLTGRFYPVFTPEALLVIAYVGAITLFIAATIAITATDIKRVLAYSTVSQLGYMMLSLGLGGWMAGMFHLITHAFFKGLLFMGSGSVIHAVHTNDMTEMGGLRKKMPITAYTMLIGCLAIIGAGVPLVGMGLSGYYSKDSIIEHAWSFADKNPVHIVLLIAPVLGAMITAFYMFRLWYMTFAGEPRNKQRYDHAHESPSTMTTPLIILAVFAVAVGWNIPSTDVGVSNMLQQARPVGTLAASQGVLLENLTIPSEHDAHNYYIPAGLAAFGTAAAGLLLATIIYLWNLLNPSEIKQSFRPIHSFLWNKWWFDELYWAIFVVPTMMIAKLASSFDRGVIDTFLHGTAATAKGGARVVDAVFDRTVVDGSVNAFARGTWDFGLMLKKLQTGSLRQYILFIVVGALVLFVSAFFTIVIAGS
ncbi:NADH-quinone oxidoreductase subunit L [Adhaeretor mobilis]|uniref:NADH-quinone oxidoreductase subunit L n=1 Tax=Adhaeretor mobilis TaxID=1930276 RepID=A0A517MV02_9BACT|nr:NADH-quinone oxidoreductase subunit L [Adhaeretor mobilis]QDS98714.1 NADH-quinone oxidoreductase subunit L [Adhaeretor mobilis]